LRGAPKNPNNVTSTFFSTVYLLQKELRFEHGGAKLASFPNWFAFHKFISNAVMTASKGKAAVEIGMQYGKLITDSRFYKPQK